MQNILKTFCIIFLLPAFLSAQKLDISQFKGMHFRNIGPAGMSGRVTAIDVDLSNKNRIFVGTASGGVWLSENGGTTWKPIFDDQPALSIGAIKINQTNPDEIWVGTGEGNPRNSHNSGAGVFRSIDGGKTWSYKGLKETKLIHRIIIHRDNPNVVLVGAMGSAWGQSSHRGVYRTEDSGDTWDKVLYNNDQTGIADLVVDPSNPNKMIAAMWEFGRTPAFFNSGGKGSGIYKTFDAGKTWTKITDQDGLPKGDLGRCGIAISASNPKVIYALVEAKENALYKSTDGGEKWSKHSTHDNIGNRPFYYYELYVDPQNENNVYSLYTYVSKSTDGGKTFEVIADYGNDVHPDHHAFWIDPDNPNHLMDGNDGGMNISKDGGETWKFVVNLPVGQFYHVAVDHDFPYNVYGGMQDNGSWAGPGFVLKRGGIRNSDWQELYFGDGFDVSPLPSDSRYGYAMSQQGNVGRYDRTTGRVEMVKPVHPDGEKLRFNWNAPIAQNPFSDCGVYYGSQHVHRSTDCGLSWEIISPDLTTNDTLKQQQHKTGGLTIDATGAENHTTLLCIAPSPVDEEVIWTGSDDGRLHITRDGGQTWTDVISRIKSAPKNSWIPQIEVSQTNAGEAFVVINNYRQNDWSAHLYHTADYGKSWKRLVNDQQVKGFVNAVVQDPVEQNLLFLGTDIGLYVSIDKGSTWTHWDEGFPNVQIRDMKIQTDFNDLVIGTFGRAFWILDDIKPLRDLAKDNAARLKQEFAVFEAPDAYITYSRSYDGIRFIAQEEFVGDNKPGGATFTLWKKKDINPKNNQKKGKKKEGEKKANKKKDDKLKIAILDNAGDTIRQYSRKLSEDGINRIRWNLRKDGVRYPSRKAPKKDADMPSGNYVLPGTYKAIFEYMGTKDSTAIVVKMDPRVDVKKTDIAAKSKAIKSHEKIITDANEAFSFIREAKESINLVDKMMVNLPDSIQDTIKTLNKDHRKQLQELEELYMMAEGLKGIQRDPGRVNSVLGRANWYVNSAWGKPGQNAKNAMNNAHKQAKEAIDKIEAYKTGDWMKYQAEIKAVEFRIFKE